MDNSRDADFMRLALAQADLAASKGQTPFGAVVVSQTGEIVGSGHNRVRADKDPTAHAEMVAIRAAWAHVGTKEMLAACTLYSSCEPCLLCSFVITQARIPRVVFAARGTDVPTYMPLLGADLLEAAAWVNRQPEWAPLEVRGEFMREQALRTIQAFDWEPTTA
jgi:tRNA(adenine34) deaminase